MRKRVVYMRKKAASVDRMANLRVSPIHLQKERRALQNHTASLYIRKRALNDHKRDESIRKRGVYIRKRALLMQKRSVCIQKEMCPKIFMC